jgi:hypothetical protein
MASLLSFGKTRKGAVYELDGTDAPPAPSPELSPIEADRPARGSTATTALVSFEQLGDRATYTLEHINAGVFRQQGFVPEGGTIANAVYGKPDSLLGPLLAVMPLLALVAPRYRFRVEVAQAEDRTIVTLSGRRWRNWLWPRTIRKQTKYVTKLLSHAFTYLARIAAGSQRGSGPPASGP